MLFERVFLRPSLAMTRRIHMLVGAPFIGHYRLGCLDLRRVDFAFEHFFPFVHHL